MHDDAVLDQGVDELGGGQEVGLVGGQDVAAWIAPLRPLGQLLVLRDRHGVACETADRHARISGIDFLRLRDFILDRLQPSWIHRPGVFRPLVDAVLAHLVDVVEEDLAVARRHVEHRPVGGDRVVHALPEVPLLRLDWIRQVGARHLAIRHERHFHRRRVADGLGQQADHVVKVRRCAQAAVPPR
jgi:hypothetical protein